MIGSKRRAFLASVGAAAIAGCSSSGSTNNGGDSENNGGGGASEPDRDNDGVPDSEDDFPDNPDLSQILSEGGDTFSINEDEWQYYEFDFEDPTMLMYDFIVREGPAIDVIVMTDSEYTFFESGERYEYIPGASLLDSEGGEQQAVLEAEEYRLVVDNTTAGEAEPPTDFDDNIAQVEMDITAAR